MSIEHVVMIIVPVIAAVGGWIGNHINNSSKRDDSNHKRVEFIVSNLEKLNEQCDGRVKHLCKENKILRDKIGHLEHQLSVLQKGGENIGKSKE